MSASSYKAITYFLLFALAGTIVWGVSELNEKKFASAELDIERLKSEKILSEKLHEEKERDKSNLRADEAVRENKLLAQEIQQLNDRLARLAAQLRKSQTAGSIDRSKAVDLAFSNEQLERKLHEFQQEHERAIGEGQRLSVQFASLEAENKALREDLARARRQRYDRMIIETTRGASGKLVSKASRVQKLKGSFAVTPEVSDPLSFIIKDPGGTQLGEMDGRVSSRTVNSDSQFKTIEMIYEPRKKLKPGTYRIEVLSGDIELGVFQVRLR